MSPSPSPLVLVTSALPTDRRASNAFARAMGAFALLGGSLALLGWILNVRQLTDWNDGGISMFVNTAICAVLCGASLMQVTADDADRWQRMTQTTAGVAAVIALLTLIQHLTDWDFGIDTLLIDANTRDWGQRAAAAPMRMGVPASISFIVLGSTLILMTKAARERRVASALALAPIAIACLSIAGYWFGADQLFGLAKFTGIALPTSLVIAALGAGLVAAIPEHGVGEVLHRNDAGGALFRRLVVPIILIPMVLGWLRIIGQQAGLYDTAFGTALRTIVEVILFFALLWWTANSMSRHAAAATEAHARLGAIVASSDDAIISKSINSIIQSWNAGAERIFGYTSAEAVGRSILLLIPAERHGEENEILSRLRRGERVEHYETVRRRKDGTLIDVSLTVSPIRDASGTVVGASKIARDISERKRSDEALRRASQERELLLESERAARSEAERVNILKDEFLATLSHELRTPLNAILGWSQLLSVDAEDPDDLKQGLEAIERNARAQTQLIEELLDMSRIISGKLRLDVQWTDLAGVLDQAVESVRPSAEAKQIRLRKIINPHPGPVSGDPTRLQQVFWNLLTNAIKFTPKQGTIDVLLERVNSHLEVTVRDNGAGIKPEALSVIFDRFRQADSSTTRTYGGLGLGLSIVKTLVELHGGTVRAESAGEDQGAMFVVHLPLAPIRAGESREHPAGIKRMSADLSNVRLSGVKVLVVDDEPDARELLKRVLITCEAEVTTAESGPHALELIRTHQPHVIVSDIGMPGMDGYEFMRRVRGLLPAEEGKTPAIALTAFARSEDRTKAMLAGYQVHVAKPIEPHELAVTVESLVRRVL